MIPVFSADNLSFQAKSRKILERISFSLAQGSFTTLIGPNGAGKSTLLQLMLGFLKPYQGSMKWASAQRLGYMPQKLNLDLSFPLSVGRLFDLKPGSVELPDRVHIEKLTQTELLKDKFISELSGGELQRVLLAYALLGNPDILLLDEPMQGLDVDSEAVFLQILQRLKYEYGKTIFMVSHDLHLVFKHSDYVICLQRHVCCQGTPMSVQENPAYYEVFGQRSESLVAIYSHHHDHTHSSFQKDGHQHD